MLEYSYAAVVELADTHDSKSCGLTAMSVRLRPAAQNYLYRNRLLRHVFVWPDRIFDDRILALAPFSRHAGKSCGLPKSHKVIMFNFFYQPVV